MSSEQEATLIADPETVEEKPAKLGKKAQKEKTVSETNVGIKQLLDELTVDIEAAGKEKYVKLLKKYKRTLENIYKKTRKLEKRESSKKRENSGLMMPKTVVAKMAEFAGWKPDEKKSSVEVNSFICKYIHEQNLNLPENKKFFVPDAKLAEVLDWTPDSEPLNYATLQRKIKNLVIKAEPVAVST